MRCAGLVVFAILELSACASQHSRADTEPDATVVASDQPLPEPQQIALTAPGGLCNPDPKKEDPVLTGRRVHLRHYETMKPGVPGGGRSRDTSYAGTVAALEHPLPDGLAEELYVDDSNRAYRSARLALDAGEMRLIGKVRSLGLREGMRFDALESVRPNVFVSYNYRLALRSDDQAVFHYEYGDFPEDLQLPDDLRVEREDFLCHLEGLSGGDYYSLRITNADGESIVLQPGQARSLGDYDVYLWVALYPVEGQRSLSGIDARTAATEIAVVRR